MNSYDDTASSTNSYHKRTDQVQQRIIPMVKPVLKRLVTITILILAGLVAWIAFSAKPALDHPFYSTSTFDVIAHRGGGGIMPENTLGALIVSDRLGVNILEMDIRLTRDHEIVLLHDQTLDRTTTCKGDLSQYDLEELSDCLVKFRNAPLNQPAPHYAESREKTAFAIPSLKQVFARFPAKKMIIEIKEDNPQLIHEFCSLIKEFNKEDQVLVGSFRQSIMDQFRSACPTVATSAASKEATLFVLLSKIHLTRLLSPKYSALQLPPFFSTPQGSSPPRFKIVTASLLHQAHAKNLVVHVWTINDDNLMKSFINMGVDGIMTDYPDRLIAILLPTPPN